VHGSDFGMGETALQFVSQRVELYRPVGYAVSVLYIPVKGSFGLPAGLLPEV
jgi:hypothetical protein